MVGIPLATVRPQPEGPEALLLPDTNPPPSFDLLITWLSRERVRLQGREERTIITPAVVLAARLKPLWLESDRKGGSERVVKLECYNSLRTFLTFVVTILI